MRLLQKELEAKTRGVLDRAWPLIASFLLVGCCIVDARQKSGSIAPNPSAHLVGGLADPSHIEFEGNSNFSTAQLRYSLLFHERFQEAAHPSAPLDGLLNTVQDEILSGYLRNGFPDVRVRVGMMPSPDRIEVRIEEGPRFICGGIMVTGVSRALARSISSWLTNAPPDSDTDESLHWQPGKPAYFDSHACASMETVLREHLARHGWFFPQLALRVERTPGSRSAQLVVEVSSLGPPGKILELDVEGNQRNSAPAILSFLHLKRGATITSDGLAAAEGKLWNSGRVLEASIEPQMLTQPAEQTKGVRGLVRIREYPEAPRIGEALTAKQKALLQFCHWLSDFANRSEDAVISFDWVAEQRATGHEGEIILSPRQGAVVSVRTRGESPRNKGYTFLLRRGAIGLFPPGGRERFVIERTGLSISPSINLSVTPNPPGSADPFNLTLFFGSNWESDDSSTNAQAGVPMLNLNLSPAAFLSLGQITNRVCTIQNGLLTVSDSIGLLKADSRTGRLHEFAYRSGGASLNVKFQAGAFTEAVRQLDTEAGDHSNAFDPGRPTASLVGFLMRELALSYLSGEGATNGHSNKLHPRAVQAINRLLATDVFAPLDLAHAGVRPDGAFFWIPKDNVDRELSQQGYNLWLPWLLERFGGGLFPPNSCTWHLMLDSAALLNHQPTNAVNDLNALKRSSNLGPVGCFAAAYLASRFSLPVYREFAAKGLEVEAAFPLDYSLLLTGDSGVALSFAQFAATLRELSPGEVDALAGALPIDEGFLLTQAYWALRSAPDQELSTSLGPLLDDYWRSVLGPKFHAGFECTLTHP